MCDGISYIKCLFWKIIWQKMFVLSFKVAQIPSLCLQLTITGRIISDWNPGWLVTVAVCRVKRKGVFPDKYELKALLLFLLQGFWPSSSLCIWQFQPLSDRFSCPLSLLPTRFHGPPVLLLKKQNKNKKLSRSDRSFPNTPFQPRLLLQTPCSLQVKRPLPDALPSLHLEGFLSALPSDSSCWSSSKPRH